MGLPPRVAAVELAEVSRADASHEVQGHILELAGVEGLEGAAEMIAILADLVGLAHMAGLVGIPWPEFIRHAHNAAVKSS